MVNSQPVRVQNLVSELMNSSNTYINFEKLADKLSEGTILNEEHLSNMVDVKRLISDVRVNKGPSQIKGKLFEVCADVQSMEDTKTEIYRDYSLTQIEKAQMQKIVSHVNNQLQYVSNARRQGITVG